MSPLRRAKKIRSLFVYFDIILKIKHREGPQSEALYPLNT